MMDSTFTYFPGSAVLVFIARRIERQGRIVMVIMGLTLVTYLVIKSYTPFSIRIAALRTERDPALVQYASDYGFLQFMGGIPMFLMVWLLSAYAILVLSPRHDPVVPRWFGYLNLLIAILYLPGLLVFFFHSGPFAWNGVVGFWIPTILLIVYFAISPVILSPLLRKLIAESTETAVTPVRIS
ncbi:hypothetical protein [Mycobacteroides abscessus]|uniref:hypothetical protein n=1 Tax=Mycobacteroides abscessus TaxID=36809 RepID=UPI00188F5F94|nr:hypothetical protein [Mycobacteroides abscessus]